MAKLKPAFAAAICLIALLPFGPVAALAAAPPAQKAVSAPRTAPLTTNGAWTTYHNDHARSGLDSSQPPASGATAGWVSTGLDGQVYGEPLVYQGLVYVSTLNNTVYALNQTDGSVYWSRHLGAPQTSGWQCGNINPTGILGTGVIDAALSRIYVVEFLTQFLSYYLVGLDLTTGTVVQTTQIAPPGFNWTIQQQRGALTLSLDGSHVYIPFGGRAGDCGPYHGWVEGAPTAGGISDEHYETPSTGSGVWAAGGVGVDDLNGNVFFATGNAIPCTGAVNSDSVIETNAALGAPTFFQPQDWYANWCGPDLDLGSATPVLLSPSLMFTSGKHGQGFLLNPAALGGTNGQLYPSGAPYTGVDVCAGLHADATFASFAYAAPFVYLECEGGGLVALHVNPAGPSFSPCDAACASPNWRAGSPGTFGPPIVAGGAVWAVDINGNGLYGFDAATGAQIYHSAGFGVTHFSTPSEAGGQIFVGSNNVVRSFNVVAGCTTMNATAAPPTSTTAGTTVTVTGSASGAGSGCANPRYQFWLLPPGGVWSIVQPYSANATFSWMTSGSAAGSYRFSVWARDASSGRSYDAFSAFNYSLTISSCTAMSAATSPLNTTTVGTPVSVTGSATGCPNPLYEFWLFSPSSGWALVQPYSSSSTFNWSTTGRPPVAYRFSVWARDASSPASYDAFSAFNYSLTLTPCTAMSATTSPLNMTTVSTPVSVTGSATGCPNPLYQFYLLPPGGVWTLVQPYSSSPNFNWSTAGKLAGSYRFSVWARDAGSSGSYDAFSAFNYTLSLAPCTAMSATTSPLNTTTAGTPVSVTGSATGCPNPLYEFWLFSPSSGWALVQPYSSSATFNWSTAGRAAGSYRFSVWARDAGSSASYDAFSAFQYTLT